MLSPATISSPAFIAIRLTVKSDDGAPHKILVRTPTSHLLNVPANGSASILLAGQRAGTYSLDVDGAPRGALVIGGEPGP
jgi:hypothetical protein